MRFLDEGQRRLLGSAAAHVGCEHQMRKMWCSGRSDSMFPIWLRTQTPRLILLLCTLNQTHMHAIINCRAGRVVRSHLKTAVTTSMASIESYQSTLGRLLTTPSNFNPQIEPNKDHVSLLFVTCLGDRDWASLVDCGLSFPLSALVLFVFPKVSSLDIFADFSRFFFGC